MRKNVQIKLSAIGWKACQTFTTDDLSEGGLYVRVPSNCGLALGQRCEVGFLDNANVSGIGGIAGETRYATVVRTYTVPANSGELIGAGLRFDQPLIL